MWVIKTFRDMYTYIWVHFSWAGDAEEATVSNILNVHTVVFGRIMLGKDCWNENMFKEAFKLLKFVLKF